MSVQDMRDCCANVTKVTGIMFVDLFQASHDLLVRHDVTEILSDGIHFKPILSQLLFKLLVPVIHKF